MEAVHKMQHGEIVGFGIQAQLALENRPQEEIREFLTLAQQIGLPITLSQLGIEEATDEDWQRIASLSLAVEDMAAMPFDVTEEMVIRSHQRSRCLGPQLSEGTELTIDWRNHHGCS